MVLSYQEASQPDIFPNGSLSPSSPAKLVFVKGISKGFLPAGKIKFLFLSLFSDYPQKCSCCCT